MGMYEYLLDLQIRVERVQEVMEREVSSKEIFWWTMPMRCLIFLCGVLTGVFII